MKKLSSLQERDLKYIFHPCSQMKDYEEFPPIVIKEGKGMYLTDEFGKKYMDCVSSWWVNLFGHSNERINNVLINQVNKLEHVIFANFSHEPAIELGEELVAVAPNGLAKLLFAENGASSIEIAIKISFQYHQERGNTKKTRFISLKNAYHGETLGALGVTDVDLFTALYKPLINESLKVQGPQCFSCEFGKKYDSCNAECFSEMEKVIKENHETLAGVVIEPMVQGVAGMRIYSPKYLIKLRELTTQYGIHFIADEIAVGFGRTGKMFAVEHAGISPDIMCIGKGLTAGYFPMSITMITDEIYSAFYDDYLKGRSFLHSHSYSGNPLGCAIAAETLRIFREDNILATVEEKGNYLREKATAMFKDHENIGEYRQIGLIGALEIVKNKDTNELFPSGDRIGYEIYQIALEKGAILRPIGNVIYFMPPYIIEKDEIDTMLNICLESVNEYLAKRK